MYSTDDFSVVSNVVMCYFEHKRKVEGGVNEKDRQEGAGKKGIKTQDLINNWKVLSSYWSVFLEV